MSKGSIQRPTDNAAYATNYDLIYGAKIVDNRPQTQSKDTAVPAHDKFAKVKSIR